MKIIEKKISDSFWSKPSDDVYVGIPLLTEEDYGRRLERLWAMPQSRKYDVVVIYGDREHFSNICYFTGYDPRWEESLLIIPRGKTPTLLVGNEGIGYAAGIRAKVQIKMFQSFSLMGQPNDERSELLTDIFADCGIAKGTKIGLVGWKSYKKDLFKLHGLITDVPHYIVETLAQIAGMDQIENAVDLLSDCEYGLKHCISGKEAVQFEAAGTKISRGIYHFLKNVKPGMCEAEAAQLLEFDGEPGNMHPNINFGDDHVSLGLNSPQFDVKLDYGMALGVGYGLRGSLVHKCGMYVRDKQDLPEEKKDFVEVMLKPYFACVVKWYEMMKIGANCGDIYDMVEDMLGMEKFGISLNPGHLTHTDEWTNSPIQKGSNVTVRSGMAFQCDYTVTFQKPFMSAHVEDGLIVADQQLRDEIKQISPTAWQRIKDRQDFIREVLNINLPEEVLPLSDLSCVCFPYMADTTIVLAKE